LKLRGQPWLASEALRKRKTWKQREQETQRKGGARKRKAASGVNAIEKKRHIVTE